MKLDKQPKRYLVMERKETIPSAYSKAPDDIKDILKREGFQVISIGTVKEHTKLNGWKISKIWKFFLALYNWLKISLIVESQAILVLQYPFQMAKMVDIFLPYLQGRKHCQVITLIHDLESLRNGVYNNYDTRRSDFAEKVLIPKMDYTIVHSEAMGKFLLQVGMAKEKIVILHIFDYLAKERGWGTVGYQKPIVIAGNLSKRKAGYIYLLLDLLGSDHIRLYGTHLEADCEKPEVYRGKFPPEELLEQLDGSYGLVWDGESVETCAGHTGEYLKYNSSHKLSLYLAAGMPVIIWKQAALAPFVEKQEIGITVDSLVHLEQELSSISLERYQTMCKNARLVGLRLRDGYYTKQALRICIDASKKYAGKE
ncbi:MAG: hypothetical protein ACI4C1_07150 [Lachnospiraceae bacterium]